MHLRSTVGLVQRRGLDLVDQAGLGVRRSVPGVHGVEHGVGLMHHQHRAFGDGFELRIGHHHRHLDDAVAVGKEAGHLHVDPDEVVLDLCHNCSTNQKSCAYSRTGHAIHAFACDLRRRAARLDRHRASGWPRASCATCARTGTRCRTPSPARSRSPRIRRPPTTPWPRPACGMADACLSTRAAARASPSAAAAVAVGCLGAARSCRSASRTASRSSSRCWCCSRCSSCRFTLYRTFVIEARFGFNKMTLEAVRGRLAKRRWCSALHRPAAAVCVLWLMARMGELWWL